MLMSLLNNNHNLTSNYIARITQCPCTLKMANMKKEQVMLQWSSKSSKNMSIKK